MPKKGQAKGAGNYYDPLPFDFVLLDRMPDEGSMLGYHQLASTISHLTKELNRDVPPEGQVTSSVVSARIRSMHVAGLCVKVRVMGSGASHGWQRTQKGKKFLADNKPAVLTLVGKEESHAAADSDPGNQAAGEAAT